MNNKQNAKIKSIASSSILMAWRESPPFARMLLIAFSVWFLIGLFPGKPPNSVGSGIFDILFIITSAFMVMRSKVIDRMSLLFAGLCFFYVINDLALFMLSHGAPFGLGALDDFIYSDKFIIYIIMMCFFVNKKLLPKSFFKVVFFSLISACTLKYVYTYVLRLDPRPTLLIENNYEQMWVILSFLMYAIYRRREGLAVSPFIVGWLFAVVIMSQSRSAVLCLIPVGMFLYLRNDQKSILVFGAALPIVLGVIVWVFISRSSSLEDIDRFRFLQRFFYEVGSFAPWNYVIGMKPLSPLSHATCISMSYYQQLFSSEGGGKCYAVVLHAFFMRAFIEHGILGITVSFYMIFFLLKRSGFTMRERLSLLGVGAVCGLSVAGIGTSFVTFPLALACAWRKPSSSPSVPA